ncbi:Ephrin type-A receptor 3 [Stylophora pistillata]|uniref:receptor protein-tyrosine kinase n=1 Tax=Stylophora pistillata TaxID=50429 RepID=A0A2B4S0R2_STYPI|nr:Ephrin type-A receptor 3 [Stylophora pistillata]
MVYSFQCGLCDAGGYVGYTCRYLHQRIEERKGLAIGNYLREQHDMEPDVIAQWTPSKDASLNERYTCCKITEQQPDSWLRSNPITVPNKVQKVDITLQYSLRNCTVLGGDDFCREHFEFYVHQSGNSTVPDPFKNNATYERITEITSPILGINAKVMKTVAVEVKGKYIVLAFHDKGSCSVIYSVIVSYFFCPEYTVVSGLVSFPRSMAPANSSELVVGSCVTNALYNQGNLTVNCRSDGVWTISSLKGRCICREDMENSGGECKDCLKGKYNDQSGLNCTVLPSTPRNGHTTFVNQSTLGLQWDPPEVTGDHTQVWYDVDCRKPCDSDDENNCVVDKACGSDVIFLPSMVKLNTTQVIVGNLSSFINYTLKIYARNRVSEVSKSKHKLEGFFETIIVRTNGSVPGIPEVSIKQPKTTVVVSWTLEKKNGVIKVYDVTYINANDTSDTMTRQTKTAEMKFDLKAGKTYQFKVFAINGHGRGPAGTRTFTLRNDNSKKLQLIAFIAGGAGALLLIILVVVIIVCVVSRRRKSKKSVEQAYMEALQQGSELQTTNPQDQRTYINPNNYIDLQELLTSFATERKRRDIKLEGVIGSGEFADVYKGILKSREGKEVVAVKVLRPGSSEKNQKDFLSEASLMGQFDHPNVIRLIGVVTQSRPMMILTEFLESGSLDHFLKDRNGQLTSLQLVGMARGVAHGMKYLSELNFIHRDLAARNVLVGENILCKVSDFGLSRELADHDEAQAEYTTQGGKIPVRWTAPEALQHRTFSSASDVWSFGILMWEIMSYCDRPYWNWDNFDVIKRVETGYRLPAPQVHLAVTNM